MKISREENDKAASNKSKKNHSIKGNSTLIREIINLQYSIMESYGFIILATH